MSAETAKPSPGAPEATAASGPAGAPDDMAASGPAGTVYLVGAGPGDPGLLTARALELIALADVILYDRLIPSSALEGARPDAELLFVGKQGGGPSVPQDQTQELMIQRARQGRSVLRLKGGDPFVFGRGGEEALALRELGIPFEIVPGVTAGVAASAYAGIPVTHRGLSTAVALITGATERQAQPDWRALAAFPGTLVFYMGIASLPQIAAGLVAAGRPPHQPVAVVENGTLPRQRVLTATLADVVERAEQEQIKAPAITIVGEVAQLAHELEWRRPASLQQASRRPASAQQASRQPASAQQASRRPASARPARPREAPLRGRTVAVTRARAQASGLARRLAELGAEVIQAPAIRVEPLPGPPLDPSPYDLICLTSPNGVDALFDRLAAGGRDARSLSGARIAAIGPGTAAALASHGIRADVVPPRFVAESLAQALRDLKIERALIARAAEARDVLPDALRAQGATVDVLPLYETVAEPLPQQTLQAAANADYITFTSSSTVRFFLRSAGCAAEDAKDVEGLLSPATRIVSIGPITSQTLRDHGLPPHVEAQPHDIDGLVAALLDDAG